MKRSATYTAILGLILTLVFAFFRVVPQRSADATVTPPPVLRPFALPGLIDPRDTVQTLVKQAAPALVRQVVQQRLAAVVASNVAPQVSQTPAERIVAAVTSRPALAFVEHAIAEASQGKPDVGATVAAALDATKPDSTPAAKARWLTGINVQGGVVAMTGHATGYIAALQWLKHGTTNDPRNLSYAILSPAFFASPNVHELGLLPVSVNVAHLVPHQPFTNLWVSPYVSVNWGSLSVSNTTFKRAGVALTATF